MTSWVMMRNRHPPTQEEPIPGDDALIVLRALFRRVSDEVAVEQFGAIGPSSKSKRWTIVNSRPIARQNTDYRALAIQNMRMRQPTSEAPKNDHFEIV